MLAAFVGIIVQVLCGEKLYGFIDGLFGRYESLFAGASQVVVKPAPHSHRDHRVAIVERRENPGVTMPAAVGVSVSVAVARIGMHSASVTGKIVFSILPSNFLTFLQFDYNEPGRSTEMF